AVGPEGDCLGTLAQRDGLERSSLADSTDLAARETIELRFDSAPRAPLGVVLTARQSLLSTYVFYQTLAWLGRTPTACLASLGSATGPTRARTLGVTGALGGVDVQVEREGRWVDAGEFRETGPLASDTRAIPLPEAGPGPAAGPSGSTPLA